MHEAVKRYIGQKYETEIVSFRLLDFRYSPEKACVTLIFMVIEHSHRERKENSSRQIEMILWRDKPSMAENSSAHWGDLDPEIEKVLRDYAEGFIDQAEEFFYG